MRAMTKEEFREAMLKEQVKRRRARANEYDLYHYKRVCCTKRRAQTRKQK